MDASQIEGVIGQALALRNRRFDRDMRLIADLGMDSYDVVSLIIEIESVLGTELDDEHQALFVQATIGEICQRLAG
jgi:acyl carrier protein